MYNPYPSFRPGQKEAITEILDAFKSGNRVIELNAPTASGKSLILYILGMHLKQHGRVIYTTPQVALVDQLDGFEGMPVLKGKRNYKCDFFNMTATECPFMSWKEATEACIQKHGSTSPCVHCEYRKKQREFSNSSFGATTFARYMIDHELRSSTSILLIDESAGLERALIERSAMAIPEEVDLSNLKESMKIHISEQTKRKKKLMENMAEIKYRAIRGDDKAILDLADVMTQTRRIEREILKGTKVIGHIENDDAFHVSSERKFRLLEGKTEFNRMIASNVLTVLASGTPTTKLISDNFHTIRVQHPITVDRRRVIYVPVGKMNMREREKNAGAVAKAISKLHEKKTIVHCGSYVIADLIYKNMPRNLIKQTILQTRTTREEAKNKFLRAKGPKIFLSVNFEEGLDLAGSDYPVNIIAKVPFENLGDEYIRQRNAFDGEQRYKINAAVKIQQAAGRCTRSPEDFSTTYILDGSFAWFFQANSKFFESWFRASLEFV